jgi:hypothetical protein
MLNFSKIYIIESNVCNVRNLHLKKKSILILDRFSAPTKGYINHKCNSFISDPTVQNPNKKRNIFMDMNKRNEVVQVQKLFGCLLVYL